MRWWRREKFEVLWEKRRGRARACIVGGALEVRERVARGWSVRKFEEGAGEVRQKNGVDER